MSFMRALATVAVGLAESKGADRFRHTGGVAGFPELFATDPDNPVSAHLARLADQFGYPGGADRLKDLLTQFAIPGLPELPELPGLSPNLAGTAGLGGLLNALHGAAIKSGADQADYLSGLFDGTPVGDAMEAQAMMMLRAMIQAAKADGGIGEAAKTTILDQLDDGVTEQEREFVREQLDAPFDLQALAADAGAVAQEQVYAMSLASVHLNNPVEVEYLNGLSRAMGMSRGVRNDIHQRMGVPPLNG